MKSTIDGLISFRTPSTVAFAREGKVAKRVLVDVPRLRCRELDKAIAINQICSERTQMLTLLQETASHSSWE